jgi:hypothetical protein
VLDGADALSSPRKNASARPMKKALTLANQGFLSGAGEMNRTPDLLITNELLYRLSYTGVSLKL